MVYRERAQGKALRAYFMLEIKSAIWYNKVK